MTKIGVSHIPKEKQEVVIYDPSCGVGSMLYDSAYYSAEYIYSYKNKDNIENEEDESCVLKHFILIGQEINGPTWFLAKVFAEISGFKNFIAFGNTLTEPFLPTLIKEKQVDFIIANPPFGMDWKSEKSKVEESLKNGMENPEESNFYVIPNTCYNSKKKDSKSYSAPKISDGQWLFFMHIAKALEKNPAAKALILSSTSLLSNGDEGSNEGIIRKHFIENGFIETVIEQPNAMFTNTDIKTHLWVMDKSNKNINNVQIIKIDNEFINKKFKDKNKKQLKTIRVLFDKAEYQIEKQKNGYSQKNIELIINLYKRKEECPLFVLNITPEYFEKQKDYVISFEQLFNFNIDTGEKNILSDLNNLEKTEKSLHKLYFMNCEDKDLCVSIDKVQKYINGSIYCDDEYFLKYEEIYDKISKNIIKGKKLTTISTQFKEEFSIIEKSINENIQKHFDKAWEIV
jgi:type I restriction enzyme M protein